MPRKDRENGDEKMKKKITIIVAAVTFAVCTCVFATGCFGCSTVTYDVNMKSVSLTTYNSFTAMLQDIRPTVVEVYGEGSGFTSAGAGVIVSETENANEYLIVTNQHVVEDCYEFYVNVLSIASDGTESTIMYKANFIGGSHERDIAVLSIASNADLSCAEWMDSDDLRVGADVIAIGNPTGTLGGTVTKGIISATSRKIDVEDIGSMDLIQFDAAINSGNSGGALFCTVQADDGTYTCALAGIVNAGTDDYEGLGFAIPSNDAKYAAEALLSTYNTDDQIYGYVEGDSGLTISVATANVMASSTSMEREAIVYPVSASESISKLVTYSQYNSKGYFHALQSISVTDADTGKIVSVDITSESDVFEALDSVSAGDTVEFNVEQVKFTRVGFSNYAYMTGTEETIETVAEQYRYTPPASPFA